MVPALPRERKKRVRRPSETSSRGDRLGADRTTRPRPRTSARGPLTSLATQTLDGGSEVCPGKARDAPRDPRALPRSLLLKVPDDNVFGFPTFAVPLKDALIAIASEGGPEALPWGMDLDELQALDDCAAREVASLLAVDVDDAGDRVGHGCVCLTVLSRSSCDLSRVCKVPTLSERCHS